MKKTSIILLFPFLVSSIFANKLVLDHEIKGTISEPITIGLLNFSVIEIDPEGEEVKIHWKGYDIKHGNANNIPFETVDLYSNMGLIQITTKGARSGKAFINNELYKTVINDENIVIKFGKDTFFKEGKGYRYALKIYQPETEKIITQNKALERNAE